MNAQLTPAPWSAFTDDSGGRPHTNIVAVVPRTDCVFSLPGHHKDEPNVKLICAAHDLLAALQMVAGKIQSGDDRPDDTFADFNGEETEIIFCAINKAT
jgi:hypothetical protein